MQRQLAPWERNRIASSCLQILSSPIGSYCGTALVAIDPALSRSLATKEKDLARRQAGRDGFWLGASLEFAPRHCPRHPSAAFLQPVHPLLLLLRFRQQPKCLLQLANPHADLSSTHLRALSFLDCLQTHCLA